MGLEDLILDHGETAERILVVSDDAESAERIERVLRQRDYRCDFVTTIDSGSALAGEQLFDMVIVEFTGMELSADDALSLLNGDQNLRRSPMLLIHRENLAAVDSSDAGIQLLPSPWQAPALLVKVSGELRRRKIRADESRYFSKVSSQNIELRDLTSRFKKELQEAQDIQNSILPSTLPKAEHTRFAATYVPLEAVGGDLYDVWKIDDDLIGLFIGDVTGHGLSAAFIAAMTKMALSYASKKTPAMMLAEMNAGMAPLMPEGRFVTVAAAFYRPSNGSLLVARGGHPPPYVWRANAGKVEEISPRGLPLGIAETAVYELFETELLAGDKFLFVTDGLTESINMNGVMLGVCGVGRAFGNLAAQVPIEECLAGLLDYQDAFCDGRVVKDDITIVGFERLA